MHPAITGSRLQALCVAPGHDIILQVGFEGTPRPSMKWTKDGNKLSKTDRIRINEGQTSSELRISAAIPSDAGTYQISLKNDAGKVKDSCNVIVNGK